MTRNLQVTPSAPGRPLASRSIFSGIPPLLALLALFAAALCGCGSQASGPAGPLAKEGGIETVAMTGLLVFPDGNPAQNAVVRLRSSGYLKDTSERLTKPSANALLPPAKRETLTDASGRYRFDSLPPAAYSLEVRGASGMGILLSARLSADRAVWEMGTDTLRPTAAVTGRIIPPVGLADSVSGGWDGLVYVQVFGEERIAWARALAGEFRLADLAPGTHILRLSSSLDLIDPLQVTVTVRPSDSLDLGNLHLQSFAMEDYSRWPHSLNLAFSDPAAASRLADLPVLVRLDGTHFDFRQSNGRDIRFADAAGNKLRYQVARWDFAAQRADIWVRAQTLGNGAGPEFLTLFWGLTGAPDWSDGSRVFDTAAGFTGVWHLDESPSPTARAETFRDATALHSHGDDSLGLSGSAAAPAAAAGIAEGNAAFAGRDAILVRTPHLRLMRPERFTISAWFRSKQAAPGGSVLLQAGQGYGLMAMPDGSLKLRVYSAGAWQELLSPAQTALDDAWHQVTGVLTGTELRLYLDGRTVASKAWAGGPDSRFAAPFILGRDDAAAAGHGWPGYLDEAMVSDQARSDEWIRAGYENQKPGSTWIRFP